MIMSEFDQWNNDKPETKAQEPQAQDMETKAQEPQIQDMETISQKEQATTLASEFQQTSNNEFQETKEIRKKRIPLWGFGIGVFAIAAVLLIIFFFNKTFFLSFANTIDCTILSPKDYYQKIEKRSMNSGIDSFTKTYGTFLETISSTKPTVPNIIQNNTGAAKVNFTFTLDPSFTESLDLEAIKPLEVSSSLFVKEQLAKSIIELKYDNTSIGTITSFLDFINMETLLQWNELSDKYLHFIQSNAESQSYEDYLQEYQELQEEISQILVDALADFPITEELLNKLLKKYNHIIYSQFDEVKREKNITVDVNGVTKKCTKLTVTLSEEDILQILTQLLNELEQDNEILTLINDFTVVSESEYKAAINLAKVFLEQYKPYISSSLDTADLILWVNEYGYIIGRELSINIDNQTVLSIGGKVIANAKDTGYEFSIEALDVKLRLGGSSKKVNDSYNGSIELALDDGESSTESFQVTYENFNLKNNNKIIQGNLTASTSLIPNYAIKMECDGNDRVQSISLSLLEKNQSLITLALKTEFIDFIDFEMPSSNILSANTQMKEYIDSLDYADYRSKLAKTFSVSEEDIDIYIASILYNFSSQNVMFPENEEIELPEGVTPDSDGYYSYELTTEEVKNRGEESSGYTFFNITMEALKPQLDTLIEKHLPNAIKKQETTESNQVSGMISDSSSYETTYFTCFHSWLDDLDSISVLYDTYSHKIISINIDLSDQETTETMLFEILKLLEPDFTDDQRESILQEIEADDYNSTLYGSSYINYDIFDTLYSASILAY